MKNLLWCDNCRNFFSLSKIILSFALKEREGMRDKSQDFSLKVIDKNNTQVMCDSKYLYIFLYKRRERERERGGYRVVFICVSMSIKYVNIICVLFFYIFLFSLSLSLSLSLSVVFKK